MFSDNLKVSVSTLSSKNISVQSLYSLLPQMTFTLFSVFCIKKKKKSVLLPVSSSTCRELEAATLSWQVKSNQWFCRQVVSDSRGSIACSPPGSSVHRISQARILEWVASSFSRGSSRPRDQTLVSCTAGGFFTDWATRKSVALPKSI